MLSRAITFLSITRLSMWSVTHTPGDNTLSKKILIK